MTEYNPAPSPSGHPLLSGPPTLATIHQTSPLATAGGDRYDALSGRMDAMTVDSTPTNGSSNLVRSNGVYDALSGKMDAMTTAGGDRLPEAATARTAATRSPPAVRVAARRPTLKRDTSTVLDGAHVHGFASNLVCTQVLIYVTDRFPAQKKGRHSVACGRKNAILPNSCTIASYQARGARPASSDRVNRPLGADWAPHGVLPPAARQLPRVQHRWRRRTGRLR